MILQSADEIREIEFVFSNLKTVWELRVECLFDYMTWIRWLIRWRLRYVARAVHYGLVMSSFLLELARKDGWRRRDESRCGNGDWTSRESWAGRDDHLPSAFQTPSKIPLESYNYQVVCSIGYIYVTYNDRYFICYDTVANSYVCRHKRRLP